MKKIISQTRKAIEDYQMIAPGDKIAVGVSGGKDSLALLIALAQLKRYYPNPFELYAITLDMGYEGTDFTKIRQLCRELSVPYIIQPTDIKEIVFDIRKEKNPCALCANLRRGALNDAALGLGCRKVALGHHFDDVIETFLLSLLYEGRISCFSPVTFLDRRQVYLIRPMIYVEEHSIRGAANRLQFPVLHNPCIADGNTKREEIKTLLRRLESENHGLRKRLFTALRSSGVPGWALPPRENPGPNKHSF